MHFDSALSRAREYAQLLETTSETYPLLPNLLHALRTLRAQFPPPDAHRREETRALLERLRAALARAGTGPHLAHVEQERSALACLLEGRAPGRPSDSW